jgi:hypothetical protein
LPSYRFAMVSWTPPNHHAQNEKPPAGHCRRFRRLNISRVVRLPETQRPSNDLPAT